jgi:hypothetical protein
MRASTSICLLLLCLGLVAGCRNAPPPSAMPPVPAAATDFSGDAAFAHLQALAAIGPRASGSSGNAQARAYLEKELENLGLQVTERRYPGPPGPDGVPQELVNLETVIAGASPQLFVLTAAYDTRPFDSFEFQGANDGASGPALLLELARVIAARPLPYTTLIAFLDREAPPAGAPTGDPLLAGSALLAAQLTADGRAPDVRLVVSFQQVGDAELHIARDLRSHRLFREEFWLAAARLGRSDAFRPADRFESPVGSQTAFLAAGFRGVVLITDTSYGGDEPPGAYANSEDDTPKRCSPQSLATVGSVSLEALSQIGERLAKIDRFATKEESGRPPAPGTETQAVPAPSGETPPGVPAPSQPAPVPPTQPAPSDTNQTSAPAPSPGLPAPSPEAAPPSSP